MTEIKLKFAPGLATEVECYLESMSESLVGDPAREQGRAAIVDFKRAPSGTATYRCTSESSLAAIKSALDWIGSASGAEIPPPATKRSAARLLQVLASQVNA